MEVSSAMELGGGGRTGSRSAAAMDPTPLDVSWLAAEGDPLPSMSAVKLEKAAAPRPGFGCDFDFGVASRVAEADGRREGGPGG